MNLLWLPKPKCNSYEQKDKEKNAIDVKKHTTISKLLEIDTDFINLQR
jgi:hypothetical protein